MIYGGVFLVGYLLATLVSGWERQRFVERILDGNGVASLLRLGLADELDRLTRDLALLLPPLDVAQSKTRQADASFGEVRAQLAGAAERVAAIKARYGNSADEEESLRRILLQRYNSRPRGQGPAAPPAPGGGGK
jgi:hypothetical protein